MDKTWRYHGKVDMDVTNYSILCMGRNHIVVPFLFSSSNGNLMVDLSGSSLKGAFHNLTINISRFHEVLIEEIIGVLRLVYYI